MITEMDCEGLECAKELTVRLKLCIFGRKKKKHYGYEETDW